MRHLCDTHILISNVSSCMVAIFFVHIISTSDQHERLYLKLSCCSAILTASKQACHCKSKRNHLRCAALNDKAIRPAVCWVVAQAAMQASVHVKRPSRMNHEVNCIGAGRGVGRRGTGMAGARGLSVWQYVHNASSALMHTSQGLQALKSCRGWPDAMT